MRDQDHRREVAATIVALFVVLLVGLRPASSRSAPPDPPQPGDDGYCGYGTRLRIIPARPQPSDPIQVIASSNWSDSCVPSHRSHQATGKVIRVDAAMEYPPGTGCADVITPWEMVVDIGTLPSGTYQAELYIGRPESPPRLCATTSFQVYPYSLTAIYSDTYLSGNPDEAFRWGASPTRRSGSASRSRTPAGRSISCTKILPMTSTIATTINMASG